MVEAPRQITSFCLLHQLLLGIPTATGVARKGFSRPHSRLANGPILLHQHHACQHHFLTRHFRCVDASSPAMRPCHHSISLFSPNSVPRINIHHTLSCRNPYLFTSCTAFHCARHAPNCQEFPLCIPLWRCDTQSNFNKDRK